MPQSTFETVGPVPAHPDLAQFLNSFRLGLDTLHPVAIPALFRCFQTRIVCLPGSIFRRFCAFGAAPPLQTTACRQLGSAYLGVLTPYSQPPSSAKLHVNALQPYVAVLCIYIDVVFLQPILICQPSYECTD